MNTFDFNLASRKAVLLPPDLCPGQRRIRELGTLCFLTNFVTHRLGLRNCELWKPLEAGQCPVLVESLAPDRGFPDSRAKDLRRGLCPKRGVGTGVSR